VLLQKSITCLVKMFVKDLLVAEEAAGKNESVVTRGHATLGVVFR